MLDTLIERAKKEFHVRLLGDALPASSHLEDTIAAWGLTSARGQAWNHAETLWAVRNLPFAMDAIEDGLDGLTTLGNKALLIPAPAI